MSHSPQGRRAPWTRLLALALLAACAPPPAAEAPLDPRLPADIAEALSLLPFAQVTSLGFGGVPRAVEGELGWLPPLGASEAAIAAQLAEVAPVFRADPAELELLKVEVDALGHSHYRFRQVWGGLEVIGADLRLHADPRGELYLANGEARSVAHLPAAPTLELAWAQESFEAWAPGQQLRAPRLVYLAASETGQVHLAWEGELRGQGPSHPEHVLAYLDAHDGGWLEVHPLVHSARNRLVYDATDPNRPSLKRTEGSAADVDPRINEAYDYTGEVYTCLNDHFSRDSFDNLGSTLKSWVHDPRVYQNAAWDGSTQTMLFGDGDGEILDDLTKAYDVAAHEIAHGVTNSEADLIYQNESGALNEAFSDIIAANCEAYFYGAVTGLTWKIGEDIYTPPTPGDALRYMNNPTLDGVSYDYYPERYRGTQDNGGVHLNSGIANLAFYLMVAGGTHPRSKTTVTVPALGMSKAAAIVYRGFVTYLTATSQFKDARVATRRAALDLYDQATADAVDLAWDAVGVPDDRGGSGAKPLQNGVAEAGLAGATGTFQHFYIDVPAGATAFKIQLSGGSGDADLYVRYGAEASRTTYDYRSIEVGNTEEVIPSPITGGRWYVAVYAYSAFSGADLVASYTISKLSAPPRPFLPPPLPLP